ncbi:MAG: A/G-specific adenine glycosylase [Moraxellaceae bacterium]|nr:A/G-specific adenine glycosylase [Moraxellaceae bacterium]
MSSSDNFAQRVLVWFDQHGRKDLPWQQSVTPYRVWVSEIMLQQTQVATVIPYFERFMARFPTLQDLASAQLDEVLHLWTGLGYYARGRNLHKAALHCLAHHAGDLPADLDALQALPGIGRSTAGAIMSLGFGQRAVILDGNVKRVLGRHQAISGDPAQAQVGQRYWQVADAFTPKKSVAQYTQAMMDLGATLCTRSKPSCLICPVAEDCQALALDAVVSYPQKRKKQALPERAVWLLVYQRMDSVWLVQRAPSGIWGGLWSFPERERELFAAELPDDLQGQLLPPFKHVFSHFQLHIHPLLINQCDDIDAAVHESSGQWVKLGQLPNLGLPQPVAQLLQRLANKRSGS